MIAVAMLLAMALAFLSATIFVLVVNRDWDDIKSKFEEWRRR